MYKILICVKDKSLRCPNKNQNLIRFIIDYLIESNELQNTTIITDSDFIIEIANHYNIDYYREENNFDNELISAYRYIKNFDNINEVILLPVTQPSRNKFLLKNIINMDIKDNDFITSKVLVNDRSIFYIDEHDKFIINSENRKGCLCKDRFMLDGSIYKIKKIFLKNVVESNDPNKYFWSGKFSTIYNDAKFFDIDTTKEYIDFLKYYTNKPQLIFFANKPSSVTDIDNFNKYIHEFDKIARVSRCTNYKKTGTDVDLLFLEANDVFFSIRNEWENYLGSIYKNIKQLYLTEWWYEKFKTRYKNAFISDEQFNNSIIFMGENLRNFKKTYCNFNTPTSSLNFLYYLLEIKNDYHITLSHIDFLNRDKTMPISGHSGSYKYESEFLLKHFYNKNLSLGIDIEL